MFHLQVLITFAIPNPNINPALISIILLLPQLHPYVLPKPVLDRSKTLSNFTVTSSMLPRCMQKHSTVVKVLCTSFVC